ncbi:uncharacterized protein C2845_PM06G03900 [Panicum miliaceum]|uniref:FHA domain-containing protein n=1 Tax=Panicum miliaceum TaxID=4540 RepID=A0A3L6R678_PANMI|nr:uncharacterized protein C2845_PM06G03900 [Panicum miliaceum]
MGALSASTSSVNWLVEDDILLKNAVETGASLESLAKGAVCFSRKFTLQEIQDRWNSLLYDPEVSTQASSRMAEYENELSTSDPAKAHKLFNSKAKDFSFQKRKIDSVKNLYYAMRKRVCTDPCNTADLGFLVAPCSCIANGNECVCGGLPNSMEPELSSVSRYGQVGASYNGGHTYPGMNGHSFHTKHAESMVRDGDDTNNIAYGYSDVGQMYEHHAYTANNHGNGEGNNVSLKSITDFQDSMQFQQLDSNQCGNGVVDSKALVIPNHFSGSVQEPFPLQVMGQPEGSEASAGAIWSGVQQRGTLTLPDDKNVKSENRDPLTFEANLDGRICTSGLDHASDFMDFPFFNNSEDFDILNGENFLNSPSEGNQEDLDDPAFKVVPGVRSTMQNLAHPDEANMSCDQIDPDHVESNVDVSGIMLVPTSLEVPCPGLYVECKLNTEDPEIPCNDDVVTPREYPLECCTSTLGQKSENTIYSVSPATSPPSNAEHSNANDMALLKVEDMANVHPSLQTVKISSSISEQKEDSVAHDEGGVLGAKPSEGPSTSGGLLTTNIDTNDANTCMLALPSFSAAGFGKRSPSSLGQHESLNNSLGFSQNSVQAPDQMQHNSLDGQPELGDEAALQNCMPSKAPSDLGIHDHIATVPTPAQAEECLDSENDVPNYYDLEALILDQDLIPWDQDSDLMHPEVTRFHHPESRKALIRLEQGARSYMNRAIISHGAFAVIYGLHLKYYIKDPEVTLGRETEDVKVDIDLGKEGRANKISRRQAAIKMDEAGSFHIKNIGKCPIFVNSKEIPSCKRINLSSDSLIEIKDMRFIFHINHDAVRQYIGCDLKPER